MKKIKLGISLFSNAFIGRILIDIFSFPALTNAYVGITQAPTFTDNGNHTFTVGEGRASFCTTIDGLGAIKNYSIPAASFAASIGTFGQYVFANYNSGSPYYFTSLNISDIDEIQTIPVFSFILPSPQAPVISYKTWDDPGILLANKLHLKTINVDGTQISSGLMLSTSGSYIDITSGSVWYGVEQTFLPAVDTSDLVGSPLTLYYHSASTWQVSITTSNPGHYVDNLYDDGNNLQTLPSGSYVVNYIYRAIGSANRTLITLSDIFTNLSEADIASPPIPPEDFAEFSPLIGRVVAQSGSATPIMVNTIFRVIFPPTQLSQHNDLLNIQGGERDEYYHLTADEYGTTSDGPFIRANETIDSSSLAQSASYIVPGATLYIVSGSNGVPPAFIEPYDYSPSNLTESIEYYPPYKEGRLWYDANYHDWATWLFDNSGSTHTRMHLGKEVTVGVRNPYPFTLPKLTPVYISGPIIGTSYRPYVYMAQADGTGLHSQVAGLVRGDIDSGSVGFICVVGAIHATDLSEFNVGDKLWLSSDTLGGITSIEPESPFEQVFLGYVFANGTDGTCVVDIDVEPLPPNPYAGIITNVDITNNNDGTITVSSGSVNLYSNSDGTGLITTYPLPSSILTLVTDSTNYIVAQLSTPTTAEYFLSTDGTYPNGLNIVRVAIIDVNYKGVWKLGRSCFEYGYSWSRIIE